MTTGNKSKSKPEVILTGRYIYLRPLGKRDMEYIRKWWSDPEIMRLTGEVAPMSQTDAEKYLEKVKNDTDSVWFVIALKDTHQIIGEAGLLRMFNPWRTTDLSIIIGEKDAWGKRYGTDTIMLLLDYAFERLNFHRVSVGVVGFNNRALRFYEKVGFKREGVHRDGYYYNQQYHDFIMMSILEDEFREHKKGNPQATE